jgi:hypothetical protein
MAHARGTAPRSVPRLEAWPHPTPFAHESIRRQSALPCPRFYLRPFAIVRIVISHEAFEAFAGTETYMLTVAQQLEWLGHDAVIYAQRTGPMADFARSQGVRATEIATELPETCDAVLAQDAASAFELAARYPSAVCVFVAHSRGFAHQIPPQLDGVCQAIVVLNERVRRFVEHLSFHTPVVRLHQPIDLGRFGPLGRDSVEPRRALFFPINVHGKKAQLIEGACREVGLHLSLVGSRTEATTRPEHAIADADLVIGTGRCVLEAMAGRRAAFVYGVAGADGWVTPVNYAALEADGFSGQVSGVPRDRDTLVSELRNWNSDMGRDNRALASANHGALDHATQLIELLRDLAVSDRGPPPRAEEFARLVRLEWQAQARFDGAEQNNLALRERLDEAERDATRSRASVDEANGRLQEVLSTRRYRLACRIAAPLDALRRRSAARD